MFDERKSRAFLITIFLRCTDEESRDLVYLERFGNEFGDHLLDRGYRYIFQFERCPQTQKVHIQGFIYAPNPCKFRSVCALLAVDGTAAPHVEASRDHRASYLYCCKAESRILGPFESDPPPPGKPISGSGPAIHSAPSDQASSEAGSQIRSFKRTRESIAADVIQFVKNGVSIFEMIQADPVLFHYIPLIQKYVQLIPPGHPPQRSVQVAYLFGEPGSGKTYTAMHANPDSFFSATVTRDGQILLDGYHNEDVLIIDDITPYQFHIDSFLRIMDVYNAHFNVKYGYVIARWTKVFITSNSHPQALIDSVRIGSPPTALPDERKRAFLRRIHVFGRFYLGGAEFFNSTPFVASTAIPDPSWYHTLPTPPSSPLDSPPLATVGFPES